MKDLSFREKAMIVALVVVLVSAGYYNFFLSGFLENNLILDERTENIENALLEAKAKASQLEVMQEELESIKEDIAVYSRDLLLGLDRPYLLQVLDLAVYPHVNDPVVSFNPLSEDLNHARVHKIDITFQTDYDSFMRVLENLRKESAVNRVINASMRISNEDERIFNTRITIEVLTGTKDMAEFKR